MEDIKYFKNKETGVIWSISNKEVIKRLSKDKNFEPVEKVEHEEKVADQKPATPFLNDILKDLDNVLEYDNNYDVKDPIIEKKKGGKGNGSK